MSQVREGCEGGGGGGEGRKGVSSNTIFNILSGL